MRFLKIKSHTVVLQFEIAKEIPAIKKLTQYNARELDFENRIATYEPEKDPDQFSWYLSKEYRGKYYDDHQGVHPLTEKFLTVVLEELHAAAFAVVRKQDAEEQQEAERVRLGTRLETTLRGIS
jgi:hypothetical protein